MVRAYILIETAANHPSWVQDYNSSIGFGMCKGLYHSLWPNEVMIHLDCQDQESLNQVIAHDIPQLEGVTRVTICMVMKS